MSEGSALEILAAEADGIGAGQGEPGSAGPGGAGPAPADGQSMADSNANALCTIVAMLRALVTETELIFSPPLKSPSVVLADDKLGAMLGPWGKVLEHYGWDVASWFDGAGPVVMALMATAQPMAKAVGAIRAELAVRRPVNVRGAYVDAAPAERGEP